MLNRFNKTATDNTNLTKSAKRMAKVVLNQVLVYHMDEVVFRRVEFVLDEDFVDDWEGLKVNNMGTKVRVSEGLKLRFSHYTACPCGTFLVQPCLCLLFV